MSTLRGVFAAILNFMLLRNSIIAGSTGDATLVKLVLLDRHTTKRDANCALVSVFVKATLAGTNTLTIPLFEIVTSDSSTLASGNTVLKSTGPIVLTGGGTVQQQVNFNVDLTAAKDYLVLRYTPDLSAANTDTAFFDVNVSLGGFDELPIDSIATTRLITVV